MHSNHAYGGEEPRRVVSDLPSSLSLLGASLAKGEGRSLTLSIPTVKREDRRTASSSPVFRLSGCKKIHGSRLISWQRNCSEDSVQADAWMGGCRLHPCSDAYARPPRALHRKKRECRQGHVCGRRLGSWSYTILQVGTPHTHHAMIANLVSATPWTISGDSYGTLDGWGLRKIH